MLVYSNTPLPKYLSDFILNAVTCIVQLTCLLEDTSIFYSRTDTLKPSCFPSKIE